MNRVDPSISSCPRPGRNISVHHPPFWPGEARPHKARRVRLQNRWPSLGYLTYLVRELGFDGNAAFAAMVQAHQPWRHSVDRRRARRVGSDPQGGTAPRAYSRIVSVVHPYVPAAPSRRLTTGGGLTEEQVQRELARKRWDNRTKNGVFEIVYLRRSPLQVSNESGIPVEKLHVYASRLRHDIRKADLREQRKAA